MDERERVRTQRRRTRAALHHHATHILLTPIPSGAASDATMQRREGKVGERERRRENVEEVVCVCGGEEGGRGRKEHEWVDTYVQHVQR